MDQPGSISLPEFARWVRDAYNHLYDTPYLRAHPLAEVLLAEEARSPLARSQNLRRVLLEAIENLRPQASRTSEQAAAPWGRSPDWRIYRIFELRYLEGLNPQEAMAQLAVSRSQFFRDHAEGMNLVTDRLWARQVGQPAAPGEVPGGLTGEAPGVLGETPEEVHRGETPEQALRGETDRLFDGATWETIDLGQALTGLQPFFTAAAGGRQVRVDQAGLANMPPLPADRVILRQALLNLVQYALSQTTDEALHFRPHRQENESGLALAFTPAPGPPVGDLGICRRLMAAVGGRCAVEIGPDAGRIVLAWPLPADRTLLAVDDNQGMLDLYRRYLAGQNWQLLEARSGSAARKILSGSRPAAILLDVMMPEEDGWELLVALKGTPGLAEIPVIVCSVVNDPQLAASLGAAACLAKPVSRQTLLEALLSLNPAPATPRPDFRAPPG